MIDGGNGSRWNAILSLLMDRYGDRVNLGGLCQ
jgi:hypothetical protein